MTDGDASYVIAILAASTLYVLLRRENRRRDRLPVDPVERDRLAFKDLTDRENMYYRYAL